MKKLQLVIFFVSVGLISMLVFGFLRYPQLTLPIFSQNPDLISHRSVEFIFVLTLVVVSVSFLLNLWIGVFAHEFGHFIAGIFVKFEAQVLIIGPLTWHRISGKWEFKLSSEWLIFGMYFGLPRDLINLNSRLVCLLLGGVLGNIFMCIIFLSLIISNNGLGDFRNDVFGYQRIISVFFSLGFLVNLTLVVGNLTPINVDFVKSDSFHLLRVIKNDPYIARDISISILFNYISQGIESENWDLSVIETANLTEKSSSYVYALTTGQKWDHVVQHEPPSAPR